MAPYAARPVIDQVRRLDRPVTVDSLPELWIRDYRLNRYLQGLTKLELDERTADIATNLLALGDDGKYRPRYRIRKDRIYAGIRHLDFPRMATDAWEERHLRGQAHDRTPLDPKRLQIAKRPLDETWCSRPQWVSGSRLSLGEYERPRMLFRFSKAKWNADFIRHGLTYISPASSHDRPGASNAVRDDELRLQWYDHNGTAHTTEVPDYHCLCMSSEYDHRLFVDFDADSCVAITDPLKFSRRVRAAIEQFHAGGGTPRIHALYECPAIYVDPFLLAAPEIAAEVYFCKHFRFAYQTEFRFVITTVDKNRLEPLILQLGSLTDIAEIVTAPGLPAI